MQNPGRHQGSRALLLMIEILHFLKETKLWELWYIPYYMGNAGFISSTVGFQVVRDGQRFSELQGLRGSGHRAQRVASRL